MKMLFEDEELNYEEDETGKKFEESYQLNKKECNEIVRNKKKMNLPNDCDQLSEFYNIEKRKPRRKFTKMNIAQNRLQRIRENLDRKIKMNERNKNQSHENTYSKQLSKLDSVFEKFENDFPNKLQRNIVKKKTADDRLKKLRKVLDDKVSKEITIGLNMDIDENEHFVVKQNTNVNKCASVTKFSSKNCNNLDDKFAFQDSEPSSEFMTKEISKLREEPTYLALYDDSVSDVEMILDLPDGDLLIIIDTNILFSHLKFVKSLLTCTIPPYRLPVIVIPWLVIQEIDCAMKRKDTRLSSHSKFANNFIHDCLKKNHPRFFAQSLKDFKENFKNSVSVDDFILQYCLKFISLNYKVIMLTDDTNLCNKAMINQLTVFTKTEFTNTFNII